MKWYTSEILPDSNQPASEFCNNQSLGSSLASTPEADENKEKSADKEKVRNKEKSADKKKSVNKGKSADKEMMDVDKEKSADKEMMEVDKEKGIDDGEIMDSNSGAQLITSASKSEYSHIQDANIAQNKKILLNLGLLSSLGNEEVKAAI